MFPPMRRKSRELDKEKSYSILTNAEFGILSTTGNDSQPYGIPLSFVLSDNTIYFHCATKGAKTDTLRQNSKVCFTVVGSTEPSFDNHEFSTYYESVMAFGEAFEVSDDTIKIEVLTLLCMKYFPEYESEIPSEIQRELKITGIWGIPIEHITGKGKYKS